MGNLGRDKKSAQMARLTPRERLKAIEKVFWEGKTVTKVCEAVGVSRSTFYKWYSKYDPNVTRRENLRRLSDQYRIRTRSPKRASVGLEGAVRRVVVANDANLSKYKLHRTFLNVFPRLSLGLHGFYNILVRLHLNTPELRRRYKATRTKSLRAWADGFSAEERLRAVERVLRGGVSISEVAGELGISRATIHNWIRRFLQAHEEERLEAMMRQKPMCDRWPRQATEEQERRVLELVAEQPTASKYKLADLMKERYGEAALGVHGVYNILRRNDLVLPEQRIAWSGTLEVGLPAVRPAVSWRDRLKQVYEQFLTTRK